jgi:hypothetical protein
MFVYIMKNESMPGLYKIGFSSDPAVRATGLSASSGVPTPFEVIHAIDCITERQARRAEASVHFILEYSRVTSSREFFALDHENIGVRALIVGAFVAWVPDYSDEEWLELTARLAQWPVDRSAA